MRAPGLPVGYGSGGRWAVSGVAFGWGFGNLQGSHLPELTTAGRCNVAVGPASREAGEPEDLSKSLLNRVKARDEAAARELVERLHPVVARVIRGHLGRRDEPEDLMQEVYLKVFGRLDQYRGEMPLEHWVSRIALNTCLDRLRRQKVRPELRFSDLGEAEQELLQETPAEDHASEVQANSARELVERLLLEMPEREAWLIRELELKGRTITEVCAETGWNSGVTRIRAFRARRRLKALFEGLGGER